MSTQLQTPTEPITREGNVFRKTNAHKGRRLAVTPNNSSMRHLSYGRIILDRSTPEAKFETGERETGLICLSGEAEIALGSEHFTLKQYDSAYIPRKSSVRIHTSASVDIAKFAAEVSNDYPIQVVRYEDLKKDKSLHLTLGSGVATRQLDIMLGGNIEAGRLIIGLVVSEPGNWTSWPPHEHGAMLEEIYVYTGMPAPAFGVQFVYTDTKEPELVTVVREGKRGGSGTSHRIPVGDGGPSRERRSQVRRGECAAGVRAIRFGPGGCAAMAVVTSRVLGSEEARWRGSLQQRITLRPFV